MIFLERISKKYRLRERKYDNRLLSKKILYNVMTGFNKTGHDTGNDSFFAVHDIDLRINSGERVGLLGKNKAGKTTLLQIISGITEPGSGKLRVEGKILPIFAQGTVITPDLTGREYIYLHGSALGFSKRQIEYHMDDIISFTEIDKIDSLVKFYSTGMRTRLSLSIAMHLPADIYIFDEVFDGSDIFFKEKVARHLEKMLKDANKTLLIVSHSEEVIKRFCDRLLFLENGKIIMDGTMQEVLDYYNTMLPEDHIIIDKKG